MSENYEITKATLAIIPISQNESMIYEYNDEFIIKKSSMQIIDESCKYYGSSYIGRFEGTKKMSGYNYKSPIIIEESNRIIVFPTASPRILKCSWIALNNIVSYEPILKNTLVKFNEGKEILLPISIFTFESQILRSTRLGSILYERQLQNH